VEAVSINIILHGDSRTLAEKIKVRPINCILTDPPYGMKFRSNMSSTPEGKALAREIANDGDLDDALNLFRAVMRPLIPKMAPDADLYVFTRWDLMEPWKRCIEDMGLPVPMQLIWNKADPGMGDLEGSWGCGYEVILFAKRGRRKIKYRRGAVIECDKVPPGKMVHPTEKPVKLLKTLLDMSTDPGDFVVDPFSGSGAVSVAAKELGRDSLAMDIDPEYVKVGTERLTQEGFGL
jgi:adenine-specific DNA-methyltransferase